MTRSHCYWVSSTITIYFSLLIHSLAFPSLHFCRHDQRDTLLEFRDEFPILESKPNPWNKSTDCCFWEGVKCDDKSGQVISLDLHRTLLNNSLKTNSSLFRLKSLSNLDLSGCNLQGEIPPSLGNLSRLINLELSSNTLVGEIPSSIGNLNQLRSLNLMANDLTREIPSSLGNLSGLLNLELSSNRLVGEIPSSIGNLKQLRNLSLAANNLIGEIPFSLGNLYFLLTLDLWSNHLVGEVPASIRNLSELRVMSLDHNRLSGSIPISFANLTKLSDFGIFNNNFTSLTSDMSGLHSLVKLDVSANSLVGPFPKSLFSVPSLRWVYMDRNQFTGPIEFANISSSSKLEFLLLTCNLLDGSIPKSISKFLNLLLLDVADNNISGTIPRSMAKLVSLGKLVLSNNKLEGEVPGNTFTNGIPWFLANLTKLETLDLSCNKLSGQIPQNLGKLSFLSYMNFSHNFLQGPVPRSTQFQRQKCSSFVGNARLYGLEDICGENRVPSLASQQSKELLEEEENMFNWVAAAIAYGPGLFCGLVIGYIFTSHNHEWFAEKFGRKKLRVTTSAR
ncbi:PREDICTED: receptor-like protein 12 [Camelina sativa]|uniref:Receptor-like protein 12 n=1 Tax=Camelina sativa TaxID=90675 RepID=A0ABM0TU60_CAMSA|nr:PREDICTED: receptor-like protein 12 [Camelina sativa]